MAGPSTQSVKTSTQRPPAPHPVTVLDDSVINEVARQLLDEFLPHVDRVEMGVENLEPFVQGFARDKYGSVAIATTFKKTFSLPESPITIHRGAGMKAWAELHKGDVSVPHPVLLEGFTAFGPVEIGSWTLFHGLAGVERLFASEGQLYAGLCCIPFVEPNVTGAIMENPIARQLFPEQKITPVSLERLLELANTLPADDNGLNIKQILLSALQEFAIRVQFYHRQTDVLLSPQTPLASIRLFINVPDFLRTIETGAYRTFDFTGILAGSEIDWKEFPLYLLPRPEKLYFSGESTADVMSHYNPTTKVTTLNFTHIDARVFLLDWFTEKPMEIFGAILVTIEAGGRTQLHFDNLQIKFPRFPSERDRRNFAAISGSLKGDVFLHMTPDGSLQLDQVDLKVQNIQISTPVGRRIGLGTAANSLVGQLGGELAVSYNIQRQDKLQLAWETHGDGDLHIGTDQYDLDAMTFSGKLLGQLIEQRYHPQLNGSLLRLAAQQIRSRNGSMSFDEPWLHLTGGEKHQKGQSLVREANLQAGAASLNLGSFALTPEVSLELHHRSDPHHEELLGFGSATLHSDDIPVHIQSRAHFKIDEDGYTWALDFDEPQQAGPIVLSGRSRVGQQGNWASADTLKSFSKFRITTQEPYIVELNGETVASDIAIYGAGDDSFIRVVVDAGVLPAETRGRIVLMKTTDSKRMSGHFAIRRDSVPLPGTSELRDINVSGDYWTVPIQEIVDHPAVNIREGKIQAVVAGDLHGPMTIAYDGHLSFDPDSQSVRFSINPQEGSQVLLGPLQGREGNFTLEGHADLKGSLAARLMNGSLQLSGRRFGLHEGQLFIELNNSNLPQATARIPLLERFMISADVFRTDFESLHLSGDGLNISTEIYTDPLGLTLGKGARKRRVAALGIQRLPLADPQYWPLLQEISRAHHEALERGAP